MNLLIVGGLGILAYSYFASGKRLENLTGKPVKLKLLKQSGLIQNLLNTKLEMDFLITNPNNKASKFQQMQLEVKYKGKRIAGLEIKKDLSLAANEDTLLKGIKINVSNLTLVNQLLDIVTKPENELGKMMVEGSFWADGYKFPYSEEIKLTE
ncbi:MAG: LEA type 2 family protein [Lentimicrobiaceae bacterium]|jgi:hypothetical protein|nr:LEA type 2 family protein [Lentimicrobiaceae bacterium]